MHDRKSKEILKIIIGICCAAIDDGGIDAQGVFTKLLQSKITHCNGVKLTKHKVHMKLIELYKNGRIDKSNTNCYLGC